MTETKRLVVIFVSACCACFMMLMLYGAGYRAGRKVIEFNNQWVASIECHTKWLEGLHEGLQIADRYRREDKTK